MKNIVLVLIILCPNYVFSASFDCSKAVGIYENTICSDSQLSKYDEDLAFLYKKVREIVVDKDELKKSQLEWIKSIRKCNDDISCIKLSFEGRFAFLQSKIPDQTGMSDNHTSDNTLSPSPDSGNETANIEKILGEVKVCFQSQDYSCAKNKLDKILTIRPDYLIAKVGLTNIDMAQCAAKKDYKCVLFHINKWIELDPNDRSAIVAKEKVELLLRNQSESANLAFVPPTKGSDADEAYNKLVLERSEQTRQLMDQGRNERKREEMEFIATQNAHRLEAERYNKEQRLAAEQAAQHKEAVVQAERERRQQEDITRRERDKLANEELVAKRLKWQKQANTELIITLIGNILFAAVAFFAAKFLLKSKFSAEREKILSMK